MNKKTLSSYLSLLFLLCFSSIARGQTITGDIIVCKGTSHNYDITSSAPGIIYQFSTNTLGSITATNPLDITVLWGIDGAGKVYVSGVNGSGTTVYRDSLTVTVLPLPEPTITTDFRVACQELIPPSETHPPKFEDSGCIKVCSYNDVVYTATGDPGSTYFWSAVGGTIGTPTDNPVTVHWEGPGQGSLTVTETTVDGCVGTRTICLEIIESPIARVRAMPDTTLKVITVCDSTEVIFHDRSYSPASSPIVAWSWDFGDGTYSNAQGSITMPVSHIYDHPGSYSVILKVTNQCGCSTSDTIRINVLPTVGVKIECPGVVCQGQIQAYTATPACLASSWSVIGGSFSGAPTAGSASIRWGAPPTGFGYIKYNPASCAGLCPSTAVVKVPVVLTTGIIEGQTSVCPNTQYIYRLPQWPSTTFNWTMSPGALGTLTPSDQPNEIILTTNSSPGVITLNCSYKNTLLGCTGTAKLTITVNPQETITGPEKGCFNTLYTWTLAGGHTGTWVMKQDGVVKGGTTGTSFSTAFNPPLKPDGIYEIAVTGTGFCPPEPIYMTVFPPPPPIDSISGPDTLCKGVPVQFTAGAPTYGTVFQWTMNGGSSYGSVNTASGDKSFITLNPGSSGPFTIIVTRNMKEFPYCPSLPGTKTVYPPTVNPTLSGDITPCRNEATGYHNSYTDAESYEWSVYPETKGSVKAGQNTTDVTVQWNDTNGTAKVICKIRKCFTFYIDTLDVDISPAFPWPGVSFTVSSSTPCVNDPGFSVTVIGVPPGNDITAIWPDREFPEVVTSTSISGTVIPHTFKPFIGPNTAMDISIYIPNPSGCFDGKALKQTVTVQSAPNVYLSDSFRNSVMCIQPGQTTGYVGMQNVTIAPPATNPPMQSYRLWFYQYPASGSLVPPTAWVNTTAPATRPTPVNPPTDGFFFLEVASGINGTGCVAKSDTLQLADSCIYRPPNPTGGGTSACWAAYDIKYGCTLVSGKRDVTITWKGTVGPGAWNGLQFYDPNLPGTHWSAATYNTSYTTSVTPGSSYTFGVRVLTSVGNCEFANPTLVPGLPGADFTFARPITCEKEAEVTFTNTSTNTDGSYGYWSFGDQADLVGYNAVRVYNSASPSLKEVTLHVKDAWGCEDSIKKNITIIRDQLRGGTQSSPKNPCEGTAVTLTYSPNLTFFLGNHYEWLKNKDTIGITTGTGIGPNTFNVFTSGYYWAHVSDQYGCTDNADADTVNIVSMPPVDIYGDADVCINEDYNLSGYTGNPAALYQWYESGTPITGAVAPTLTQKQTTPGTHTYTVEVSIPKPGGGFCIKMSDPFTVTVHGDPAPPTINFSVVNCNPYQVQLTAVPSLPGTYNWSNGASGNPVIVPLGGPFQVTYTDLYGCQSKAVKATPKDPHVYLWIFPSGCYSLCATSSYSVVGPIIPFAQWKYYKNFPGIFSAGSGYVPPQVFTATGVYSLELNNGYCSARSGNMNLTTFGCGGRPADVNELSLAGEAFMSLVPNPASGTTRIDYRFTDNGRMHIIDVYDITGRKIDSKMVSEPEGSWLLNLNNYTPGLYQVVLREGNQVLMKGKLSVLK